jgi:tetratricopeptide (TPR) repeat protein
MIAQYFKKMKRWSYYCPENFKAKYALLAAEIARTAGDFQKAMNLYDEAITSARENEFLNTTALANELTAGFYMQYDKIHIAQMYLEEAVQAYGEWGATAKVNQLEEEFSDLLKPEQNGKSTKRTFKTDTSTKILSVTVDYQSILKASQALSAEIVYDKVLVNMMNIVMENAGADRFITLFCGILDWKTNRFRFTNAGHDSPFFFNGNISPSRLTTGSLVLGMIEDFPFEEHDITFQEEDPLVIYSDGVPEAMNDHKEDFGESRLEKLISQYRKEPVNELMERIIKDVKTHIGTAPQSDDITLLLIKRTSI